MRSIDMTPAKLKKLIQLLKEQGITSFNGEWAGEAVNIQLGSNESKTEEEKMEERLAEADQLFFQNTPEEQYDEADNPIPSPSKLSREELIKQFDADLF